MSEKDLAVIALVLLGIASKKKEAPAPAKPSIEEIPIEEIPIEEVPIQPAVPEVEQPVAETVPTQPAPTTPTPAPPPTPAPTLTPTPVGYPITIDFVFDPGTPETRTIRLRRPSKATVILDRTYPAYFVRPLPDITVEVNGVSKTLDRYTLSNTVSFTVPDASTFTVRSYPQVGQRVRVEFYASSPNITCIPYGDVMYASQCYEE